MDATYIEALKVAPFSWELLHVTGVRCGKGRKHRWLVRGSYMVHSLAEGASSQTKPIRKVEGVGLAKHIQDASSEAFDDAQRRLGILIEEDSDV
jgi:hypothetical protein